MTVETTNPGSYAKMEGAILSCEDMEFQAEYEEVTVIPNFQGVKLALICVRHPLASRQPPCCPAAATRRARCGT